jgi:hypothetical protein
MSHPISTVGHIEGRSRTNKHYAKAIKAVPGYLEATALRDKAQAKKRDTLFPVVVWPSAPTDIEHDLDKYLADYTAAFEEEQTRERAAAALDTVVGACERQMRAAIDDPDALLTVLSTDLDELMAQVKNVVTRLNGATTPTEAINNDTVDAWKELPALRREYDSIRHAQTFVLLDNPAMNHRSEHINDPLASDAIIRNLDELLPSWRDPDTRFAMQGAPPDRRPWPEDDVEQLVWLINSGADVWLPTSTQLAKLHTERRHRLDPPPAGDPGNLTRTTSPTTRRPVNIIG